MVREQEDAKGKKKKKKSRELVIYDRQVTCYDEEQ